MTQEFARKRKPVTGTRYSMEEVSLRIERMRVARGVSVAAICEALGFEKWDYSKKLRLVGSRFTVEECGRIADAIERISGQEVPVGWPFIDERLGALLGGLSRGVKH